MSDNQGHRLPYIIANLCRFILAAVFVFSGAMKIIDPWGTAKLIAEYGDILHMAWLSSASVALAIALCAGELTLGLMLLTGVRLRIASLLTMIAMVGFTGFSLVTAIWNPLDNCGCFGDAIKVESWNTFYKNLILLPLSVYLWYRLRKRKEGPLSPGDAWLLLFIAVPVAIGLHSWRHLPPVDLYPYKVGVDLRSDVLCTSCIDRNLKVIYLDRQTGMERTFEMSDTTWYDDKRWQFVRLADPYDGNPPTIDEYDFAMWRDRMNDAADFVYAEGTTYLVVMNGAAGSKSGKCRARLAAFLDRVAGEGGATVVFVAGVDRASDNGLPPNVKFGERSYPNYGMEKQLLKLLLRADAGVVTIRDGIIVDKAACWDLK